MKPRLEPTGRARRIAEQLLAVRAESPPAGAPRSLRPAPSPAAIDYPRLQRRMQWFDGVLRLYRAAAQAVADQLAAAGWERADDRPDRGAGDPGAGAGCGDRDADPLIDALRRAHGVLLEHPVAARAAYRALAAQGRAYAATPEGAALRARLVRSPRLRRASLLWRSLTMGMLDEQDPGELPATYLDNLLRAIDRGDLEQLLGRLQVRREPP